MRKSTFFIDIDGTVLEHKNSGSTRQWHSKDARLLDGVLRFFNQLEKDGHCIVLVTARPECLREKTEKTLLDLGLFWNQLVMGITSGSRYLINDGDASAISLERNEGLGGLLDEYVRIGIAGCPKCRHINAKDFESGE